MSLFQQSLQSAAFIIILLCVTVDIANARIPYRTYIPNSDKVPCPAGVIDCTPETTNCYSLGHYWTGYGNGAYTGVACNYGDTNANATAGGRSLDDFGRDVAKNTGSVENPDLWGYGLCSNDSDSDGVYNGIELGDPCCQWSLNSTNRLQRTTDLSHPGLATSVPSIAYASCLKAKGAHIPAKPTTFTVDVLVTTATITWVEPDRSVDCVCGYHIYAVSTNYPNGTHEVNATYYYGQTTGGLGKLKPNQTEYSFTIVAFNEAGKSEPSDPILKTTIDAGVPFKVDKPTVENSGTSVIVSWNAPTEDGGSPIIAYSLQLRNGQQNLVSESFSNSTGTKYEFVDLPKARTFMVRVRAENAAGAGPWSYYRVFSTEISGTSSLVVSMSLVILLIVISTFFTN